MQKVYPIYSKFFLNLYIVYELNDWPPNISNNFETQFSETQSKVSSLIMVEGKHFIKKFHGVGNFWFC